MRYILLTILLSLACLAYCSDVDEYNQKRREYAKKNNIANMFKMENYDELQKQITKMPDFCTVLVFYSKNGGVKKHYRHYFIPENKVARDDQDIKEKLADLFYGSSAGRVEYLMPTQDRIVCRKSSNCKEILKKETWASENIPSIRPDLVEANYEGACYIGPHDDLSQLFSEIIEGEAGSKCEQYGRINEDGLCARIPPTTTQPPVVDKVEERENFSDASSHNFVTSMFSMVAVVIGMII